MAFNVNQGTSIFHLNSDGLDYTGDNETLTIDPAISVVSAVDFGVFSNRQNSVLANEGNILSLHNVGVDFSGSGNSIITNATDASIGGTVGISVTATGNQIITNDGTITGTETFGLDFGRNLHSQY
jgi:hypothetical protein